MDRAVLKWAERWAVRVRRSSALSRHQALWNTVRPLYDAGLRFLGRKGLARVINGTDEMVLSPACRHISETYEPDLWRQVIEEVQLGDVVADVGANIGLYTLAVARRIGPEGRVFAFEPDPENYCLLRSNIELNKSRNAEAVQAAVGDRDGLAVLEGAGLEAHVATEQASSRASIRLVSLDSYFGGRAIDVLKVDVEGFEEQVLSGAVGLLSDPERAPRTVFLEVHPYAYGRYGSHGNQVLTMLRSAGYSVKALDGEAVASIDSYGQIVARRLRFGAGAT